MQLSIAHAAMKKQNASATSLYAMPPCASSSGKKTKSDVARTDANGPALRHVNTATINPSSDAMTIVANRAVNASRSGSLPDLKKSSRA